MIVFFEVRNVLYLIGCIQNVADVARVAQSLKICGLFSFCEARIEARLQRNPEKERRNGEVLPSSSQHFEEIYRLMLLEFHAISTKCS